MFRIKIKCPKCEKDCFVISYTITPSLTLCNDCYVDYLMARIRNKMSKKPLLSHIIQDWIRITQNKLQEIKQRKPTHRGYYNLKWAIKEVKLIEDAVEDLKKHD